MPLLERRSCRSGSGSDEQACDGAQTRSLCHVDDLVQDVMVMCGKGEHLAIYHVGTAEEIGIADLARRIAKIAAATLCSVPRLCSRAAAAPLPRYFETGRARLYNHLSVDGNSASTRTCWSRSSKTILQMRQPAGAAAVPPAAEPRVIHAGAPPILSRMTAPISPRGRLRYADRLRRPRWRNGQP
jgi:hypothetical protein